MSKQAVVVVPGATLPYGVLSSGEWNNGQVTVTNVPGLDEPVTFTLAVMTPAQTPPANGTPVIVESVDSTQVCTARWDTTELAVTQ